MADFQASEIVKEYVTPAHTLRILDGVSIELNRGENLAILGESGSGKSTLLHIMGTLDTATSGRVKMMGADLSGLAETELADHRNAHVGFVFQQHHLLPQLSALDNVLIPTLARGTPDASMVERAQGLLAMVGLEDRMNHQPGILSGGEQQRVAVARALINEPGLILADEPTGSLDSANAEALGSLLLKVQQETNAMLVCVTHSEKLASQFSQTVRLERGELVGK